MTPGLLLADPRRRNLAILGAVALASLLLAILALWLQARETAAPPDPTEFLPGFAHDVRSAAHIHVQSKAGIIDVMFLPEKGWVVAQRHDYPASFPLVQRTLVGLATLRTIEPKTARPDWLHYLDLDAPPAGNGILISVGDDKNRPLAAIIAGKSEDIGDPTGAAGLFVRKPDDTQSWLVRSVFDPRSSLSDWLDKTVLSVDRASIQEVDVDPAGAASYVVARAHPSDADFALMSPAGAKLGEPAAADGVASALADFGFDDVRPAVELDFSNPATAARLVTKTFDGLWVTAHIVKAGADYWATLSAEAAPGTTAAMKEAAAINAHAHGWAYKLGSDKGQLFMTTLDSLTKPSPAMPAQPGLPGQP